MLLRLGVARTGEKLNASLAHVSTDTAEIKVFVVKIFLVREYIIVIFLCYTFQNFGN